MGIVIGGEKAWKKYRKGDIALAYHWINGEPAMVLFPGNRMHSPLVVPFAIPLATAHQYVDSSGHPNLLNILPAAIDASKCLGMTSDPSTLHRIIDAIVDGIPDLVSMPPEPAWADLTPKVDGELSIKRDGEIVTEVAV